MKISVVTATSRRGYLECVAHALGNQTLPASEFEWIVIDDHAKKQSDIVSALKAEHSFAIQHKPPDTLKDIYAPAAARNQGVRLATGEIIFYSNEYILPGPMTLERHWNLHQEYGPIMLSGRVLKPMPHIPITLSPDRVKIDKGWRPDFPKGNSVPHIHSETRQREHSCQPIAGMTFEETPPPLFEIGDTRWWWAGRNDSVPRSILLDVCKFHMEHLAVYWEGQGPENEIFDGGWGYPDQQLAEEVSLLFPQCRYLFDTLCPVMEIPHARGLGKKIERTPTKQQALAKMVAEERAKMFAETQVR